MKKLKLKRAMVCLTWLGCSLLFFTLYAANKVKATETTAPTIEYQVKASLIFNFIQFTEWPELPPSSDLPFKICVFGTDQFGSALSYFEREVVFGRHVKKIVVTVPSSELEECQILFVSADAQEEAEAALNLVKDKEVLTIGESADFLDKGGVILLAREGKRVVFDINRQAATEQHLKITSKLLRLAREVRE